MRREGKWQKGSTCVSWECFVLGGFEIVVGALLVPRSDGCQRISSYPDDIVEIMQIILK